MPAFGFCWSCCVHGQALSGQQAALCASPVPDGPRCCAADSSVWEFGPGAPKAEACLVSPLCTPIGKSCWWPHCWPRIVSLNSGALQKRLGCSSCTAFVPLASVVPVGVSPARGMPEVRDRELGLCRDTSSTSLKAHSAFRTANLPPTSLGILWHPSLPV